ncbi:MAG TPA: type II 3-dehydroquinate dehydratase [Alphaproteobacteria bacterium]|nr:MAG: 3-dehydroquinate dehydratase [Alphaproteobacteria bacterium MarineAlpha7_Bin1]HAE74956.1 type II 3-dehydroquinate dehydratase [Alphaproteobacteria bacterium]|tara:strand:+ start:2020 stop:2466 length:447 start_codon:yes stop_codon:yes gene_type:complete
MSKKILIINGPNLNLLGDREPEVYGNETLDDIKNLCEKKGKDLSLDIDFTQSNDEGEIVESIQNAKKKFSGIIINAGALTHTSISILDALLSTKLPIIEVHLSNIFTREAFRKESFVSKAAKGIICGFGSKGYDLALEAISTLLKEKN